MKQPPERISDLAFLVLLVALVAAFGWLLLMAAPTSA